MPRPTMFDEYGRCIHCGFWHADLDSDAAQVCGEHEARGCACALNRAFHPLPVPRRTAAGLYVVPGHPEYDTAQEIPRKLLPTVGGLLNSARPVGEASDDGVALTNIAHPWPVWWKRPWLWLRYLVRPPRLDPDSIETIEIEVKRDG